MNKDETILEIMKYYPTQKIGLDDFYGRQTVINMMNKAINYTRCSLQLKDKEVMTFDKWLEDNKYTLCGYRNYLDKDENMWAYNELHRNYKTELNL